MRALALSIHFPDFAFKTAFLVCSVRALLKTGPASVSQFKELCLDIYNGTALLGAMKQIVAFCEPQPKYHLEKEAQKSTRQELILFYFNRES
jgi:hypothetical protein